MKTVLVTGGFDPLHSGHIEYFKEAKKLGDRLVVGVNSDEWLTRKKGRPFLPFHERAAIIKELKMVDQVISFNDSDDTANHAIMQVLSTSKGKVVFANGGDRSKRNTPEMVLSDVEFVFGVGGDNKKNSSSWILDEWKTQKTERDWGYWRVLDDKQPRAGIKVKELVIEPRCSLSDQKHKHRSEHWYVLEGEIQIELEWPDGEEHLEVMIPHTTYVIPQGVWHKTTNIGTTKAHILEVQYGKECVEEDIERRNG